MTPDFLKYFADSWQPDYTKFKYSGWALLDKIKKVPLLTLKSVATNQSLYL